MDYLNYNRQAWNSQVRQGNQWTVPVSSKVIEQARNGNWSIVLTPRKPVPRNWFGELTGSEVLCLAGGGGQQAPVLAAAGASVTTLDNSEEQLQQDRKVAKRDGLKIETIQGNMSDLSSIENEKFDLVVNPCSNCFVPQLAPVWNEAFRVLKPGGRLLSGWSNPIRFIFDSNEIGNGKLVVRHKIPYSDITSITDQERQELIEQDEPMIFGHSLADQIGGQLEAGFRLIGFYEDDWSDENDVLSHYIQDFGATCAEKPESI